MNKLKQILVMTTLFVTITTIAFSQMVDLSQIPKKLGSTHAGKEFWLTFFPNYNAPSTGLYLFISSKVSTVVNVEIPGKGWSQSKSTIPNDVILFTIPVTSGQPYNFANATSPPIETTYNGAGIHVYSNDEIVVYAVSTTNGSADGFTVLPVSVLGRDYIVSSWPDNSNNTNTYYPSYTSIIAAYDQTRVSFMVGGTPSTTTRGGLISGKSSNWTLYKGDVLIIPSAGKNSDLTGSIIGASKPVAVVSGNRCASIPETATGCDYLIEQEIPIEAWGTMYHVTPIATRTKDSYIRIFAKNPGTTNIYRDGSQIGQLDSRGGDESSGWLSMRADVGSPRPIVISGSQPIMVTQYNPTRTDDNSTMDPFQINLVSVEQYQNEFTFNPPRNEGTGFTINYINIIYQSSGPSVIPDDLEMAQLENGDYAWRKVKDIDPTPGDAFAIVNNGINYYCKTLPITKVGMYGLRANTPIMAYCYGTSLRDAYGYSALVGAADLEKNDTLPPVPTWTMDCDGNVYTAEVDDMPQNMNASNISVCFYQSALSSNYDFTCADFVPGDVSKVKWTLTRIDKTQDARAVITFGDRSGNDTTVVINYYESKFKMNPFKINFGLIKKGDTLSKDVWIVNQSTTATKEIKNVFLKRNNQGYQLLSENLTNITLPFTMPPDDSIKIKILFTNPAIGNYLDTISVSDDCNTFNLCNLTSQVGGSVIQASDQIFSDTYIGSTTTNQLTIYNSGLLDLTIKGYQKPDTTIFEVQLPEINDIQLLTISPQQLFAYYVTFKPKEEKEYIDSIVFSSNTNSIDSVSILKGNGIKKPSGVNDNNTSKDIGFTLYPNPVEDNLMIQFYNNESENITLRIFDTYGNLVADLISGINRNYGIINLNYNTNKLSNGLYFIQLNTPGNLLTKTFTVLH